MRRMISVMLVLTGLATATLFAAEPAPPAKSEAKPAVPATPPTTPAATMPKPAAAGTQADATESSAPESPEGAKTTASKGPSPQRFTPTEQVRADFDVSFPIDI